MFSYRVVYAGVPLPVCGQHVHEVLRSLDRAYLRPDRIEPGDGTCRICEEQQ